LTHMQKYYNSEDLIAYRHTHTHTHTHRHTHIHTHSFTHLTLVSHISTQFAVILYPTPVIPDSLSMFWLQFPSQHPHTLLLPLLLLLLLSSPAVVHACLLSLLLFFICI